MAYIKFKELTHYFNFNTKLSEKKLPEYVYQYISEGEKILAVFSTMRDKVVFTDKKLILFDLKGVLGFTKKIEIYPHNRICTSAIVFNKSSIYLLFTFLSGYQTRLNFIRLSPEDKKELRELYYKIYENMDN
ncbi:MAG: PH domain-containing protein [Tenericutes bacterium]|nr:PH domain-containing protein [Bacilli bacterium]NLV90684.1 PH domain-containing protein [Mycoplasmatota bacterium]